MTTAVENPHAGQSAQSRKKTIFGTGIGNALEWFDLAIYALMAIYIGQVFFPQGAPGVQTLSAFAVFGATYLIRPLGGLVLGAYADDSAYIAALAASVREHWQRNGPAERLVISFHGVPR